MINNYFKTAWRNLVKSKFYSLINISGLAIGLAVGIMILLWVQNESSFDSFHHNADQIYKINSHIGSGSGAQVWDGSPAPLAVFCKQSVPEVINSVRIKSTGKTQFIYGDKKFIETDIAYVDPSFFAVFDFKITEGNAMMPFRDKNSVVITSSLKKKYFGNENAVGKILVADKQNFVVTGVMDDFPENSSIRYNVLLPMSLFASKFGGNGEWKTIDEDLGNYQYAIYLQLQPESSPETVAKKITKLYIDKKGIDAKDNYFTLQSLKTLHLIYADGNSSGLQKVRIFLIIAILILLIACINYVNLSTARSMFRYKEVSVRKIIGATKNNLFFQFIIESVVLFLLASILAFCLIYLLLPLYNNVSGRHLLFSLKDANVWLVIGTTISGTLIIASIYPAMLLSSFKPILALKGKLSMGLGTGTFRKILVVTQFVFSVVLIIGTIVISSQLQYIRDKDLGFDKEQVITFSLSDEMHNHYDAMRNELLKQPGILSVATSDNNIIGSGSTTGDTEWDTKQPGSTFLIHPNGIDQNLIPLLKMQMTAGANFTGTPSDSAHFILNETAVKQAGIQNPIGKTFKLWNREGTIIGAVKDFNYASLKQAIEPAIFYFDPPCWTMYIKTTGHEAASAIAASGKVYHQYNSDFPFEYSFMNEEFEKLYQSDQKTGELFNVFSAIAILISCLGLFGLVSFTARVKTKEIGIRKVLGASVPDITVLITKDFIVLILIAFAIASPVAWYAMTRWLQSFSYRISFHWWFFALAALAVVLITLFTVSFQSIKAAIANPVKSLRTE